MISRQLSKGVSIAVGDTVFKAAPERQAKLTPKFSGPFIIKERLHANKFRNFDPALNESEVVHVERLKRADVALLSSSDSSCHLHSRLSP